MPAVRDLQKLKGEFGRETDFPYKGGVFSGEIGVAFNSYDTFYSSNTAFTEGSDVSEKLKFYLSRGVAVAGEMSITSMSFFA